MPMLANKVSLILPEAVVARVLYFGSTRRLANGSKLPALDSGTQNSSPYSKI